MSSSLRPFRFGWWSLLVFVCLGPLLERLHGFKVGGYLAVANETALHAKTIDVSALKHLFPDWEFRDEGFPKAEDFVNLPPHHGYIRIGTASNVMPLAPPRPTTPDPARRSQILERLARPTSLSPSTTDPILHDDDFITAAYDDDPDEAVSA